MINVAIETKDYALDDDLRGRATDRIGGLDEFMDTLDEGRVTFSWDDGANEQTTVFAEVRGGGERFEASDTDWKAEKALDQTRRKLESQIRRRHSQQRGSHDRHR
jgi:ribosome-associated translation inhibitor RaiA